MAGTQRTIPYLESQFETGDIPTQADFYDFFASFVHYLQVKQVTGSSTSDLMSQKAVTDAITAAINNLIDASPGALDTLNELAAALGDDPNFAATITAALANKQTLNANLSALAALASAADKLAYFTGSGAAALTDLSAFIRTLLDDPDAATARATLGVIGKAAVAPTDITGTISGGAISVNCGGDAVTEKNIKTDSNLNINWTNLNEGGILFLRLERTTTSSININFNGGANADCHVFGNTQIIGSGSPLLLQGYTSGSGRNRIVYLMSIEAQHDITANKTVYAIRYEDSASIVV